MTSQGGYLAGSAAAPVVAIVAFAVGALIGALNGICTAYFGMPSFLVTLTTMMFFSGSAILHGRPHDSGSSIGSLPAPSSASATAIFSGSATSSASPMPASSPRHRRRRPHRPVALGVRQVALRRRAQLQAAAISGVPVNRVIIWTFISGLLSAIAAISIRPPGRAPILGQRILLDIIGAAVIGGVSLFGGTGKVSASSSACSSSASSTTASSSSACRSPRSTRPRAALSPRSPTRSATASSRGDDGHERRLPLDPQPRQELLRRPGLRDVSFDEARPCLRPRRRERRQRDDEHPRRHPPARPRHHHLDGVAIAPQSSRDAQALGIAFIHQGSASSRPQHRGEPLPRSLPAARRKLPFIDRR